MMLNEPELEFKVVETVPQFYCTESAITRQRHGASERAQLGTNAFVDSPHDGSSFCCIPPVMRSTLLALAALLPAADAHTNGVGYYKFAPSNGQCDHLNLAVFFGTYHQGSNAEGALSLFAYSGGNAGSASCCKVGRQLLVARSELCTKVIFNFFLNLFSKRPREKMVPEQMKVKTFSKLSNDILL